MSVPLPQEKKDKIVSQYQVLLQEKLVSIRVLTQVLGRPSFTTIAVLVAPLQYWVSQRQQIAELVNTQNFDLVLVLTEEARKKLQLWAWWKSLINLQTNIAISTNSSLEDRGLITKDRRQGDHENFWRRKVI